MDRGHTTMTTWTEKLRLKGMAEEDIYFARRDRELIDALHERHSHAQRSHEAQSESPTGKPAKPAQSTKG
jgi:hypothetical protein